MNVQDQKLEGTIADLQQQLGTAKQRIEELESFQFNYEYAVKIEREDHKAELEAAERKLARARDQFEALGSVVPCERYEDDVILNGLCLISDMVAPANPKYPMLEAYEAVAVWLKDYARAALAQIEQPHQQLPKPEVIDTPSNHALAELYKDPEFLAEYRKGMKEEREELGLRQPTQSTSPESAGEQSSGCSQTPHQQLPGEDSDDQLYQCPACAALRARAQAESTP